MRDAEFVGKNGVEEVTGGLADTRTGHTFPVGHHMRLCASGRPWWGLVLARAVPGWDAPPGGGTLRTAPKRGSLAPVESQVILLIHLGPGATVVRRAANGSSFSLQRDYATAVNGSGLLTLRKAALGKESAEAADHGRGQQPHRDAWIKAVLAQQGLSILTNHRLRHFKQFWDGVLKLSGLFHSAKVT